ncbi:MAG: hypothetical protein FD175_3052 [Beijerinckiaceae bacterium]|nr:MAG: hypothetical protein FD175_3052 [Beijerinckiaceae bacterium]
MRLPTAAAFLAASFLAASFLATGLLTASAHEPRKGPNGGALVDAGKSFHVELVIKGSDEVVVILSDINDKPVPSVGFKANAILIVSGKTTRFALEPVDGSRLVGKAPVAIPTGTKGAIQLTAPDGTTAQAKF